MTTGSIQLESDLIEPSSIIDIAILPGDGSAPT
jgi:hypothetical protein